MEIIDIHSHLLPGVDDSRLRRWRLRKMLTRVADAGVTMQVFTPHIDDPYVHTKRDLIQPRFEEAAEICEELGVRPFLASEFYVTDQKEFTFIPHFGKYVLCETSPEFAPQTFLDVLRRIRDKGYGIIMAHVERYKWLTVDSELFGTLTGELEALVQVNVRGCDTTAGRSYLEKGVVDFIATDNHGDSDLPDDLYETLGWHPEVARKMSDFAQKL